MVRIIHLVEDLKIGGLEKVVAAIVVNSDSAHYESSVWCVARGGAIADDLIQKGMRVDILGITSYFNPLAIVKLAGKLKKAKPAIIHTHGYYAGTIGRLAGLLAGRRGFFHHVHSSYIGYSKRNFAIERVLGLFTNKILCCSRAVADHVHESEHIPLSKIEVVYNGVPPHETSGNDLGALRNSFGIRPEDRVIVTVASLVENKGHACLINAMGKIAADFPTLTLLVAGDGKERKRLEQQADDLHIRQRVVFAGIRRDIPDLLAIAELFVLASRYREGLGISIIEAMAAGKPVIGTKVGGIPEVIVHNGTGLVVPPSDSDALAKAMCELLSNRNQALEFGKNGYRRYQDVFTEEKMVRRIEQLYHGAITK